MIPTKEQAGDLLCEYNEGEFHRLHARIVGDVMRYFAVQLGYADEADFWQTVGILHDLDFEQYPDPHCPKEAELLREKGVDARLVHAVVSHGYLLTVDGANHPESFARGALALIDALAAGGGQLDNFFCVSPVCSPARASLEGGTYGATPAIAS